MQHLFRRVDYFHFFINCFRLSLVKCEYLKSAIAKSKLFACQIILHCKILQFCLNFAEAKIENRNSHFKIERVFSYKFWVSSTTLNASYTVSVFYIT